MCEVVEKYAEERAREAAKKAAKEAEKKVARNLFLKGVDYKLVQQSVQNLTKKRIGCYL